jgi:peptide/nickel transport system substrate-binding protein
MPRLPLTGLTVLVAMVALTGGCGRAGDDRTNGFLTVGIGAGPNGFDPRLTSDEGSERVAQLVYSRLLELDDRLRAVPGLAERVDRPDPLTWVVTLRDGVRFHDGRLLTSADVLYTLRTVMDPATASPLRGAYRSVEAIDAPDARTVRFRLKEPVESFPMQLVISIVPDGAGSGLRTQPVGTGPYRFVSATADDRVVLERFDGYFRGPAANPGIVLRILPDDTMRGLELRHGGVDLVINDVPPDLIHALDRRDGLRVVTAPGTDYSYIGINIRDAVLSDARLRRALAMAVDRQAIVTHLRRSLAGVATGLLPPISWAVATDVPRFDYDPDASRRALDAAGYADPDGPGPAPRLTLTLKISTNEFARLQATVLQENFRAVGVELDVRQQEFATLFGDVVKGNFQMVTLQWVGGAVADPDILRRVFHSDQIPPGGFNRGRYMNPEVDRLLDAATRASGEDERRRLYQDVQRIVAADQPYISLWYRTNAAVLQPWVTGLRLGTLVDFERLSRVSLASVSRPNTY